MKRWTGWVCSLRFLNSFPRGDRLRKERGGSREWELAISLPRHGAKKGGRSSEGPLSCCLARGLSGVCRTKFWGCFKQSAFKRYFPIVQTIYPRWGFHVETMVRASSMSWFPPRGPVRPPQRMNLTSSFSSPDHCVHYYDLRNTKQPIMVFKGHRKAVSYAKFVSGEEIVSA